MSTESVPEFTAERQPAQYEQELQELFTVPDELVDEWRPQLWQAAEKVAGGLVDPLLQEVVRVRTGIIDWAMFSRPGDSLPEGMILVDVNGEPVVQVDPRLPFDNGHHTRHLLDHELRKAGANTVYKSYATFIHERTQGKLDELITGFIEGSAEYGFLQAFQEPADHQAEKELDPYWLSIRQGQEEDRIRARYGIVPGESLSACPEALTELKQAFHRLSLETHSAVSLSDDLGGLQRVRDFFGPLVLAKYLENEGKPGRIHYEEDVGTTAVSPLDSKPGDLGYSEIWDIATPIGLEIVQGTYDGPVGMRGFPQEFIETVIEDALNPRETRHWPDVLKDILHHGSKRAVELFMDQLGLGGAHAGNYSPPNMDNAGTFFIASVKAPNSTIFSEEDLEEIAHPSPSVINWEKIFRSDTSSDFAPGGKARSGLLSGNRMFEAMGLPPKEFPIGQVEVYGPNEFRDGVSRMIVWQILQPDFAPGSNLSGNEDLVLSIDSEATDEGMIPFVPGFELVSYDEDRQRYGFVVDENSGDPYFTADVQIDEQELQGLAGVYEAIGMDNLAEEIRSLGQLNVSHLVELLQSHTKYVESESMPVEKTLRGQVEDDHAQVLPEGFAAAKNLIKRGRFHGNCVASARLLRSSLEYIFGPASAGIVGGSKISGESTDISNIGHAQVVFPHGDRQYILDSTGVSRQSRTLSRQSPPVTNRNVARRPASSPQLANTLNEIQEAGEGFSLENSKEQIVDGAIRRLEIMVGAQDKDDFYGQVVKLSKSDPLRRTVETLIQYRAGKIGGDELRETYQTLQQYEQLERDERERIFGAAHSDSLASQMRFAVGRLEYLHSKES